MSDIELIETIDGTTELILNEQGIEISVVETPAPTVVVQVKDVEFITVQEGQRGPAGRNGTDGGQVTLTYIDVTPSPNGSILEFITPDEYVPTSLLVFLNGLLEYNIVSTDDNKFSFSTAPQVGDIIKVCYNKV